METGSMMTIMDKRNYPMVGYRQLNNANHYRTIITTNIRGKMYNACASASSISHKAQHTHTHTHTQSRHTHIHTDHTCTKHTHTQSHIAWNIRTLMWYTNTHTTHNTQHIHTQYTHTHTHTAHTHPYNYDNNKFYTLYAVWWCMLYAVCSIPLTSLYNLVIKW